MMWAKAQVTFFVYTKLIISFGPWAFVSGPPTPVAIIIVFGYIISISFKNGIDPPSPYDPVDFPLKKSDPAF